VTRLEEPIQIGSKETAMKPIRVLVPLDGSPLSEAILPLVRGLDAAAVTLVQVVPAETLPDGTRPRLAADLYLVEAAERLRAAGLPAARPQVRVGKPADEVLKAAAEVGADLIALTTHGRSGFDRFLVGSVAERVVRASPIPVLALRASEPAAADAPPLRLFERVLVPFDGSEPARHVVGALARLGAAGQGRVILYGVVESYGAGLEALVTPPPNDLVAQYLKLRCDGAREDLDRAATEAAALGFDAGVDVAVGAPAGRILDWAEALPATLIAMGTHGRTGLSRWTLGSVAEKVLRASTVPLLICK